MPGLSDDIGRLIPYLRRFARALVRGHGLQAADDVVQETVVLAMRTEGLGRGPSLTIWCFAALLRVHRMRRKQILWERQGGAAPVECEADEASAQAGAPVAFLSKDIARLDSLPLQNREVLLLTVLAGMSYARVAEVLTLPLETVLIRLTEARDMLARAEPGRLGARASPAAASPPHKPRIASHLRVVK